MPAIAGAPQSHREQIPLVARTIILAASILVHKIVFNSHAPEHRRMAWHAPSIPIHPYALPHHIRTALEFTGDSCIRSLLGMYALPPVAA